MSDKTLFWADQTLNTGVRHGISAETLSAVAAALTAIGAGWFDIQLTAWLKYDGKLADFPFADKARCVADNSLEQAESAWQAGFRNLLVTYTFQRWRNVSSDLEPVLTYAREQDMTVFLHIVNASELGASVIRTLFPLLEKYEVQSIIVGDRDSRLQPLTTQELIAALADGIPCRLGFHAHNTLGMATANTYGALRAGATDLAVAAAGIGCCGHAALEEVLVAAKCLAGREISFPETLAADLTAVLQQFGYEVPISKAIIGEHIFSHESGIHVNGIRKDTRLYEAFEPEMVGLQRRIVLGKHSGATAIRAKFEEWGLPLETRMVRILLKKIRRLAVSKKNIVDDIQIKRLYYRMHRRSRMKMVLEEATGDE